MVTAAPTMNQAYSASFATDMSIPEDPTIKDIFDAAGDLMQLSATVAPCSMDNITFEITKYQVAIMDQKGATSVNQRGNSYYMNAMMLSTLSPNQCHSSRVYMSNLNGEANPP